MISLEPATRGSLGSYDALGVVVGSNPPREYPEAALAYKLGDFRGKLGESLVLYRDSEPRRLILAGVEAGWPDLLERLRQAVGWLIRRAREKNAKSIVVDAGGLVVSLGRDVVWTYEQVIVAADMANYVFVDAREAKARVLERIGFLDAPDKAFESARVIAEAVRLARDFGNQPPSRLDPEGVEKLARRLAEENGLEITVFRGKQLLDMSMEGIYYVGKGSVVEPRLIILGYRGGGRRVAVVGKTVTFDAGGLDIKTAEGMLDMKYDKCGGGIALAAVVAAARLKLPVTVYALLPVVENLPSGSAYKPRDVLRMYNGLRVEVLNTDAEGRLALADAIAYAARELNPDVIIDVATLTGAAVVALGNHAAALFSNRENLLYTFRRLGDGTGEHMWPMPLWPVYEKQLESKVADLANVGGRPGGAITAAKFLEKFTEGKPWVHIDIAGVAWVQDRGPNRSYYEHGATAWSLRTIIEYLRRGAPA